MNRPDEDASANQAYGALTESLHIAGYTLERAFRSHLEPLIGGDAWRRCAGRLPDLRAFMPPASAIVADAGLR